MSRTIGLDEAIGELTRVFTDKKAASEDPSDAFFFLVGAGLSAPGVPLAGAIEQDCRGVATEMIGADAMSSLSVPDTPMGRYAYWLRKAYAQPIDRRDYFRDLIENTPVSAANFRLAHLISTDLVPRLVVTPNFDDFLSRALGLFGRPHVVCDHPATTERIDPERRGDIQILHVHGTYWFYDCCNLQGEIADRAATLPVHHTVASRLDHILDCRSPIVIGYSGWEQDVIMQALQRRLLARRLPYNLYWFCYSRSTPATLPAFLRGRDDVCFVVPPEEPPARPAHDAQGGSPEDGSGDVDKAETMSAQSDREAPRLDAVQVLDALSRNLAVSSPDLTRNPVAFFAAHLRSSLIMPTSAGDSTSGSDIYQLESMIKRLEGLAVSWDGAGALGDQSSDTDAQLELMRDAIRRSAYREVIEEGRQVEVGGLSSSQRADLIEMASLAATNLFDDSPDELAGYSIVIEAIDAATPGEAGDGPGHTDTLLTALRNQGAVLAKLGRAEEALDVFDDVKRRFADNPDPLVREPLAQSLYNKGRSLYQLGRLDEAVETYSAVDELYGGDSNAGTRHAVASALRNKAVILSDAGESTEALVVLDEIVRRYADDEETSLRHIVGRVHFDRGICLDDLDRPEDALKAYEESVQTCLAEDAPQMVEQVANALVNKGLTLGVLERYDEAIAVFDDVGEQFATSFDPALRHQSEMAMGNGVAMMLKREHWDDALTRARMWSAFLEERGGSRLRYANALFAEALSLEGLQRDDEAVAAYERIIEELGGDDDLDIQQVVADARNTLDAIAGDPPPAE